MSLASHLFRRGDNFAQQYTKQIDQVAEAQWESVEVTSKRSRGARSSTVG